MIKWSVWLLVNNLFYLFINMFYLMVLIALKWEEQKKRENCVHVNVVLMNNKTLVFFYLQSCVLRFMLKPNVEHCKWMK